MFDKAVIYTDGGCWPNPGIGGWGAVLTMQDSRIIELTGGENPTTNNRMELMGPISALEFLTEKTTVTLYSDSQYVVNGITEWIHNWKKNNWKNKQKKKVVNRELWERLESAHMKHKVTFKWIRGHSGNDGNERADELSKVGAIEIAGRFIDFDKYRWK